MLKFQEDQVVFREGEMNRCLYKVLSGSFARYIHYGEENELLVNVITPGKCFGEMGFFTEIPSHYTVVATEESLTLDVKQDNFQEFITQNPKNAIEIIKSMSHTISILQMHNDHLMEELLGKIDKQKCDNEELKRKIQMYQNFRF